MLREKLRPGFPGKLHFYPDHAYIVNLLQHTFPLFEYAIEFLFLFIHRPVAYLHDQLLQLLVLEFLSPGTTELVGITIRKNINTVAFLQIVSVRGERMLFFPVIADREFIAFDLVKPATA